MKFDCFRIGMGMKLSMLCSLFSCIYISPSFASSQFVSGQLMAQNSNYQESTLSVSRDDLRSGVTLTISGQESNTVLSLKVNLNGKTARWIKGTGQSQISLNSCLNNQNQGCVIDISGSYSPSYSGVLTEILTVGGSSQQQTGGSGIVSQRIQVLVR
jgi:hypothetical protein